MDGASLILAWALSAVAVVAILTVPATAFFIFRGLEKTQVSGGRPVRDIEIEAGHRKDQLRVHEKELDLKRQRQAEILRLKEQRQARALDA